MGEIGSYWRAGRLLVWWSIKKNNNQADILTRYLEFLADELRVFFAGETRELVGIGQFFAKSFPFTTRQPQERRDDAPARTRRAPEKSRPLSTRIYPRGQQQRVTVMYLKYIRDMHPPRGGLLAYEFLDDCQTTRAVRA